MTRPDIQCEHTESSRELSIPVTAIILTYNEEMNISRCVEALSAFDEVVVVDSVRSDGTIPILARSHPHVRVFFNPFIDFGQQRNWAIDYTDPKHDWILFIDADEFMEPPLAEEIHRFVRDPGNVVGGFIAGRNYFLGQWLKYSTFYPSYQLRLLKKGEVRYRREGHGQREVTKGELTYLKQSWRHELFSQGIHHWIHRHNQYSSAEVELLVRLRNEPLRVLDLLAADPIVRRRAVKLVSARLPARGWVRMLYTYIFRLGFLDGRSGLIYAMLRLGHELALDAKLQEATFMKRQRSTQNGLRGGGGDDGCNP